MLEIKRSLHLQQEDTPMQATLTWRQPSGKHPPSNNSNPYCSPTPLLLCLLSLPTKLPLFISLAILLPEDFTLKRGHQSKQTQIQKERESKEMASAFFENDLREPETLLETDYDDSKTREIPWNEVVS